MTGCELRQKACDIINSHLGETAAGGLAPKWVQEAYDECVDRYKKTVTATLPRGSHFDRKWAWCAATWTAVQYLAGLGDQGIYEMSCSNLITIAKAKGVWIEDESMYGSSAHPAQIGDGIIYDWDDDGKGDCKGAPEHVGMITEVHPGYMVITEGNFSKSVKKRTVLYNAKQIRGFICPDYDAAVNGIPETVAPTVQPSTTATTGTINTGTNIPMYNLYRGNKGETVRTAQALLNLRLQLTGTKNALDTDGSFGPLTESMVERYNKSIGNSGKAINGVTWNHLMKGG